MYIYRDREREMRERDERHRDERDKQRERTERDVDGCRTVSVHQLTLGRAKIRVTTVPLLHCIEYRSVVVFERVVVALVHL
jgi:hypothetical protein